MGSDRFVVFGPLRESTTLPDKVPDIHVVPARTVQHNPAPIPIPIVRGLATGRLRVQTDAVVSHILTNDGSGKACGVVYLDRVTKRPRRAFGKIVVLCASAFESVRILMNSVSEQHPAGIGGSSGLLGRYVCDHVMYGMRGPVSRALLDYPLLPLEDAFDFSSATVTCKKC